MSPRSSTLLALIAVLLAGIPLPALTGARHERPADAQAAEAPHPQTATRSTYATLQWSGQPASLLLLHEERELAQLSREELALTPAECELELPAASVLELELIATWPGSERAEALSITLEPEGQPARQCTQWTAPGSNTLHALFSFTW